MIPESIYRSVLWAKATIEELQPTLLCFCCCFFISITLPNGKRFGLGAVHFQPWIPCEVLSTSLTSWLNLQPNYNGLFHRTLVRMNLVNTVKSLFTVYVMY